MVTAATDKVIFLRQLSTHRTLRHHPMSPPFTPPLKVMSVPSLLAGLQLPPLPSRRLHAEAAQDVGRAAVALLAGADEVAGAHAATPVVHLGAEVRDGEEGESYTRCPGIVKRERKEQWSRQDARHGCGIGLGLHPHLQRGRLLGPHADG